MKVEKLEDGSYATTPVFMGAGPDVVKFQKMFPTCQHEWEGEGKKACPENAECMMTYQKCKHCRAFRVLTTGPQEALDSLFT
jgi:hypothetical protein